MAIYRLTYVSTASRPPTKEHMAQLVANASAKNGRLGITGVLLFNDANFLQTLEGERTSVEALMDDIRRDPRHSGLIVIGAEDASERVFEGWSLNGIHVHDSSAVAGNDLDTSALPRAIPAELLQLYRSFNSLSGGNAASKTKV